jgi:hypothetical protein
MVESKMFSDALPKLSGNTFGGSEMIFDLWPSFDLPLGAVLVESGTLSL